MTDSPLGWKFIDELWNQKLQPYDDGYYDGYYNGLLYTITYLIIIKSLKKWKKFQEDSLSPTLH